MTEDEPPPRRWRARWREFRAEERAENAKLRGVIRRQGPLYASHQVARGELGGPLARFLAHQLPIVSALGPRWRFRFFAVCGPLLFGWLVLLVTNELLAADSTIWQVVLVGAAAVLALCACALTYLLALRPTRGRVLSVIGGWSREDLAWWGLLMLVLPTVAFAAVTAVLVHHELIGAKGVQVANPRVAYGALETYAWHFADAVPVLKVPETLMWKPQLRLTTSTGGALVLAYKVLLVLPLVQLAAIGLSRSFGDDKPEAASKD